MKRPIPRISTRGYYDLSTGKTIKKNPYYLYPKGYFSKIIHSRELAIMVHGLRNDSSGAAAKTVIARNTLRRLRYKHPVVGYSYDSNVAGAHLLIQARHAIVVGQRIATKNGRNLSKFITDFKRDSPTTRIRLLGHSLGSQVILSAAEHLYRNGQNRGVIESVHLFGASIADDALSSEKYSGIINWIVRGKVVNYFSPTDGVLFWANAGRFVRQPLGLHGISGKPPSRYRQRTVSPKNHRFASYAAVLKSFP